MALAIAVYRCRDFADKSSDEPAEYSRAYTRHLELLAIDAQTKERQGPIYL